MEGTAMCGQCGAEIPNEAIVVKIIKVIIRRGFCTFQESEKGEAVYFCDQCFDLRIREWE